MTVMSAQNSVVFVLVNQSFRCSSESFIIRALCFINISYLFYSSLSHKHTLLVVTPELVGLLLSPARRHQQGVMDGPVML